MFEFMFIIVLVMLLTTIIIGAPTWTLIYGFAIIIVSVAGALVGCLFYEIVFKGGRND